jgi:hypothetical protein
MTAEALYVYGVVPRAEGNALTMTGVDGSDVEMVEHEQFAALTSRIQTDSLRAPRELRRHWRVLQQACDEAATVVPVRFGTVLENERAVREDLLDANAEQLAELLALLDGCVQMTIKGTYVEDRVLADAVRSSPALSRLAARVRETPEAASYYDRIRLGEGIAQAVALQRDQDAERAFAILEPAAVTGRAEDAPGQLDAFNLAFLVKRGRQDDFSDRVRDLGAEFEGRIDVRYVGPLPPYSFAEGTLVAGGS